jgi:hypothetical protein
VTPSTFTRLRMTASAGKQVGRRPTTRVTSRPLLTLCHILTTAAVLPPSLSPAGLAPRLGVGPPLKRPRKGAHDTPTRGRSMAVNQRRRQIGVPRSRRVERCTSWAAAAAVQPTAHSCRPPQWRRLFTTTAKPPRDPQRPFVTKDRSGMIGKRTNEGTCRRERVLRVRRSRAAVVAAGLKRRWRRGGLRRSSEAVAVRRSLVREESLFPFFQDFTLVP